jgi:hypothetical protein
MKLPGYRLLPISTAVFSFGRANPVVRIRRLPEVGLLWVCVFITLMTIAGVASAQQRYPIQFTAEGQSAKYVQQLAIDVGDMPGHQVRAVEIHRTYTDASNVTVQGTRVQEAWIRAFTDYIDGKGPAWGYETWVLADGDKIFLQFSGNSEAELTSTGSRRGINHGTTRIVGGTGKYKGIRGLIVYVNRFDSDPKQGYNQSESKGHYWFID